MNHEMPLLLWSGEEKVVGGVLTLKQLSYLVAGAGLSALLFLQVAAHPAVLAAVPLPGLVAAVLAFASVPRVGMPLDAYLLQLLRFRARPKEFPYARRGCAPPGVPVPVKGPGVQDVLGFADIQGGIVRLPGGRFRLVCEVVGRVNFFLLSQEEQARVDARFQRFVLSLTFPVQIYVQSRYLDISGQVERAVRAAREAGPELSGYASDHAAYLRGLMAAQRVLVQRIFLVVPYDGEEGQAEAELRRRAGMLAAALGEDLWLRVLDTAGALDVLYAAWNRERAVYAPASQAAEYGFLEPLVRGVMPSDVLAVSGEETGQEKA